MRFLRFSTRFCVYIVAPLISLGFAGWFLLSFASESMNGDMPWRLFLSSLLDSILEDRDRAGKFILLVVPLTFVLSLVAAPGYLYAFFAPTRASRVSRRKKWWIVISLSMAVICSVHGMVAWFLLPFLPTAFVAFYASGNLLCEFLSPANSVTVTEGLK